MGMTENQKEYIDDITKNLDVNYPGSNNCISAHNFISKHEDDNRDYRKMHGVKVPATIRQLEFIGKIERTLGITFTGQYSDEASDFIDEHIKNFRKLENKDEKRSFFSQTCKQCGKKSQHKTSKNFLEYGSVRLRYNKSKKKITKKKNLNLCLQV